MSNIIKFEYQGHTGFIEILPDGSNFIRWQGMGFSLASAIGGLKQAIENAINSQGGIK